MESTSPGTKRERKEEKKRRAREEGRGGRSECIYICLVENFHPPSLPPSLPHLPAPTTRLASLEVGCRLPAPVGKERGLLLGTLRREGKEGGREGGRAGGR